ncbi:MAG TPA: hypothetical protein VF407_08835, partial [Polyangiaceae bacterium]
MRRTSNVEMRKATPGLAVVMALVLAAPACARVRSLAKHESASSLAVATTTPIATDSDGGVDAGTASTSIPNRLVPFASARLAPCGRPSGCGPWQVSWSADDSEVALLGDDVITVLDARGLGPKRRLRTAADAVGERCFQAMVPTDHGIDFVDLQNGKTARHFEPARLASLGSEGAKLALADDCTHWSSSLPVTNAVFEGDRLVRHPFAALQADDTTSRIVPSGHFLQWNVVHDGKPMTAFEDTRALEPGVPTTWFGPGSVLSPDDALVVDTGGGPRTDEEYERGRIAGGPR